MFGWAGGGHVVEHSFFHPLSRCMVVWELGSVASKESLGVSVKEALFIREGFIGPYVCYCAFQQCRFVNR